MNICSWNLPWCKVLGLLVEGQDSVDSLDDSSNEQDSRSDEGDERPWVTEVLRT